MKRHYLLIWLLLASFAEEFLAASDWKLTVFSDQPLEIASQDIFFFRVIGERDYLISNQLSSPSHLSDYAVDFEAGEIDLVRIGEVHALKMYKQSSLASSPDWTIKRVELTGEHDREMHRYTFTCNCRLSTDRQGITLTMAVGPLRKAASWAISIAVILAISTVFFCIYKVIRYEKNDSSKDHSDYDLVLPSPPLQESILTDEDPPEYNKVIST